MFPYASKTYDKRAKTAQKKAVDNCFRRILDGGKLFCRKAFYYVEAGRKINL